jgi:hypothetical protein
MGIRTAANANHVAVLHDQSLHAYLYLRPCDRRHGIFLHDHVHALDGHVAQDDRCGRCGRDARGDQIVRYARCDGMSLSCRFGLDLRGDVARQQLWTTKRRVNQTAHCLAWGCLTCSCCNSSFFASKSSLGTPTGLSCALSIRSHSSLQNAGVSLFRKPVSWIWISLILGCGWSALSHTHSARITNELILLDKIEACFDYDVVFVAENRGDLVCNPFLHQVNVDLFNVHFLVELRWKLSRLEALLVYAKRHDEARLGA